MLVLALQFSKGSERGRNTRRLPDAFPLLEASLAESDRAGHTVGSGSASSVPFAEVGRPDGSAPSKRKRRQSVSSRPVKRTNPAIDLPFRLHPPMHQLGVVRTG